YCYCEVCREEFRKLGGADPLTMSDPSVDEQWRQFRYDRITRLVNETLIPAARAKKKQVTAAVFPNWEAVRQQWSKWNLDAVMPMLYHGFYNKDIEWIGEQTRKGVKSLRNPVPLYSGVFVPQLTPESLEEALTISLDAGAEGVVLFSAQSMTPGHWQRLGLAVHR
ncbi:MAG TPA: Tat pathway signal protein, partial [Bacteroidota bacterium]